MPDYICSKNANEQGAYVVHNLECDYLPSLDNRVNAQSHDTHQGALDFLEHVNEGRGLHFSVCEYCCHLSPITTGA